MATPPTLDADYHNDWLDGTSPATVSVTAASGKFLLALGVVSWYNDGGAVVTDPPTGGPTWTSRIRQGNSANFPEIRAWTGTSTGNYTHSQAASPFANAVLGAGVYVFSGSDGYDNAAGSQDDTDCVPQQTITTTTDNCSIVWCAGDGNAASDTARDYLSVNGNAGVEDIYVRDPTYYTVYVAHWNDVGAAGAKTVGLNSYETGMYMSQVAVAVKGAAAGPPTLTAQYETPFDDSTPNTVAVTAASGTTLVAIGANSEYNGGFNELTAPTGHSPWTSRYDFDGSPGNACDVQAHTGTSAGNFTHSQSDEGGTAAATGALVYVYSNSDGYDNAAGSYQTPATDVPPTQAISTTTDNCALVWVCADYQAVDYPAPRTYTTINGAAGTEDYYFNDGSFFTLYACHWNNVGTAGSKTAGLVADTDLPSNMDVTQVAVSIKGTAGGPETIEATASGAFGGLTGTVTAVVTHNDPIVSGAWGGLGASASATVSPPGGATIEATASGAFGGLGATATATVIPVRPFVVESQSAAITASRSPSLTFTAQPQVGDVVIMFPSSGTTATITIPSGWENPLGGTTDIEPSDSTLEMCVVAHIVTQAEFDASTKTYTATNLYDAGETGAVVGCFVRNVDLADLFAGTNTSSNAGNTTTPHVLPGLTPDATDGLLLSSVAKDGTGTYTNPGGWTELVQINSTNGRYLGKYDTYTTASTPISDTNITPNAGDEYVSISVVLKKNPPAVQATASGAWGGLTGTATAEVASAVEATASGAWGGLTATATATVGVGKNLDTRWDVKAALGDQTDLQWAIRTTVNDNSDLRWGVRTTIGDQEDLQWTVKALVTDSSDLQWGIRTSVSDQLDIRWAVGPSSAQSFRWSIVTWQTKSLPIAPGTGINEKMERHWATGMLPKYGAAVVLTDAQILRWSLVTWQTKSLPTAPNTGLNTLGKRMWLTGLLPRWEIPVTAVGKDSDFRWTVKAALGDQLDLQWSVKQAIGDQSDIRWGIRTIIGDQEDFRWTVSVAIGDQLDLQWQVLAPVGVVFDEIDLRWQTKQIQFDLNDLRWAVKTKFNDSIDVQWGVRTKFNDSIDYRWTIRSLLGDQVDFRWNLKFALGDSNDLRWGIRVPFNDSSDLRWSIRSLINDSSDLRWGVRTFFNDSIDLRWGIRTFIGDQIDYRWAIRSLLGNNNDLRWRTGALAGNSTDVRWSTRLLLGDSNDLQWGVRIRASDTNDLRWRVATTVGDSNELIWAIRALVGDNADLQWQVISISVIQDSIDLRWGVRTPVNDSIDTRWNVRFLAGDSNDLRWGIRTNVNDSIDLQWRVLSIAAISDDIDLRWAVKQVLGDAADLRWKVWGYASKDTDLRWALRTLVGDSFDTRWSVKSLVHDQLGLVWMIIGPVGVESNLLWNTRALVTDNLDFRWRTAQMVQKQRDLQWMVKALAGDQQMLIWDTKGRVTDNLDIQWGIRTFFSDQIDYRWAIRNLVGQSRDLRWALKAHFGDQIDLQWRLFSLDQLLSLVITLSDYERFKIALRDYKVMDIESSEDTDLIIVTRTR